jgi:hypothetical protein
MVADNVTALSKAPKGEDYSGPVLFEGVAGAQIFAEVLGKNLALTRRPVSEGGRGGGFQPSELEGRIGARVLPDSFDVVDDPTQTEWRGRPLFGHYETDREGVAPAALRLVEKGVLKGYLLTRQPVRGFEGSNGRARMPGNYGASTAGARGWECEPVTGSADAGTLFFYTRLRSAGDTVVQHRWYQGDRLFQSVDLRVSANSGAGYRTYSRQTVTPARAGDWRVELRAQDGTLLGEERFTVRSR